MKKIFSIVKIVSAVFLFNINSLFAVTPPEVGVAVVIDEAMQGKKLACNNNYDKNQKTAAHKTLPCGTKIKVTNLGNNKSVEVTIVDKGPNVKGQIVALSTKAATEIDLLKNGETKVKVEVIENKTENKSDSKSTENKSNAENKSKSSNSSKSKSKTKEPELNIIKDAAAIEKGGLYKMQVLKLEPKGFGVQVAGYSDYESVIQQVSLLQKNWFKGALVFADELKGKPYYKIIMGPFFTREEADAYADNLKKKYNAKDAFVVDLEALNPAEK
jgi:rare lipoprotein A